MVICVVAFLWSSASLGAGEEVVLLLGAPEEFSTIAKILLDQIMDWKGLAGLAFGGHVAGLKPRIRDK